MGVVELRGRKVLPEVVNLEALERVLRGDSVLPNVTHNITELSLLEHVDWAWR